MQTSFVTHGLVVIMLFGMALTPHVASAAYTAYGQTFGSAEEMAVYVREYLRVYNELSTGTSKPTTVSQITKQNTTHVSRVVNSSRLEVTTSQPEDVDMYTIHLAGRVYYKSSKAVRVWFEYGPSYNALYFRSDSEVLVRSGTSRTFDIRIAKLNHNTTYYYRAVALNETGVYSYGTIRSAKTNPDPSRNDALIKASTRSAKSLDEDRVFLEGSVAMKKAPYATVWFEYGEDEDRLDYKTPETTIYKKGAVPHRQLVSRLDDATIYFYRVVARDPRGTLSFGKLVKFTTKANVQNKPPFVESYKIQDVTGHDATATALFDMNDFSNGRAFMVYGEDRTLVTSIAKTYTRYKDIREYGDRLQKVLIDNDLDRILHTTQTLMYLDPKTAHYVAFGIEHENDEDDDVIIMSRVQSFTTKETIIR